MIDVTSQKQLELYLLRDIQDYYSVSFILVTITDDEYYFNVNFSNCLFTYEIKRYVDIRNSDKLVSYDEILLTLIRRMNKDIEEIYENSRCNR